MADTATNDALLSPALMARLEQLELVSRQMFRGRMKGERRSKRKGESVEFADFRNYVPGDDLRLIDWNLYARLDQLFLKMFQEEEDLHFYALIDNSDSMTFGDPSKLKVAAQVAAALGYIGLCRADRVKVQALGQSGLSAPAMRGRSNVWKMLDYLSNIPSGENQTLTTGIRDFVMRNSNNGVVLLITDLMDKEGYQQALRSLIGRRMDVYVLHLLSPEELEPDVTGDLRLVDIEDGDVAEITANSYLLEKYRKTVAGFIESARQFCSRRSITYMLAR
ncbi:MAG: DUF58 domain-containing protein, partial [Planctomycetota bacterium]